MKRYVITWIREGKRYALSVGYKHTAEFRAEKYKGLGYENVEFMTLRQFNLKFGKEEVINAEVH